jgi:hypothetical protein
LTERAGARSARSPDSDKPLADGKRWVSGYWHWDGVRYVWIGGKLEADRSAWHR